MARVWPDPDLTAISRCAGPLGNTRGFFYRARMSLNRLLPLALIACACGPTKPDQTTDDPSTSAATTTAGGTTAASVTSDPQDPTTGPAATSDEQTSSSGNPSVVTTLDSTTTVATTAVTTGDGDTTTGELIPCDLSLQDCPEGQKCSVFAMSIDDLFQGMFKCVPLDPNPVPPHAPCDVFGDPADGTDNCELGSICLFPDDGGIGECFAFCNFNQGPICKPEGDFCVGATCQTCLWSFCDSPCDPLDTSTCEPDEVCGPNNETWTCVPDSSGDEGQHGDTCEFVNACDPGLVCIGPDKLPDCAGDGCCSTTCDTTAPNTCPDKNKGTTCKPWYAEGTAPTPELENLGVCSL
jgi:hypothetical protein